MFPKTEHVKRIAGFVLTLLLLAGCATLHPAHPQILGSFQATTGETLDIRQIGAFIEVWFTKDGSTSLVGYADARAADPLALQIRYPSSAAYLNSVFALVVADDSIHATWESRLPQPGGERPSDFKRRVPTPAPDANPTPTPASEPAPEPAPTPEATTPETKPL